MTYKANNPLSTTQKSLRLVELLREHGPATVTELAERSKLSKGTIHHHLNTLAEFGFVINDEGTYKLGTKFLEFGGKIRHNNPFYCVSRVEVDSTASQCGELGQIMIAERGEGVYLYHTSGHGETYIDTYAGRREPLHCTALGKSILANLPIDEVQRVFDEIGLPAVTDETTTDQDRLETELEEIRARGYALEDEEFITGIRGVGVPIKSDSGSVRGAIGLSGSATQLDDERWTDYLPGLLLNAKNEIEVQMNIWHTDDEIRQPELISGY